MNPCPHITPGWCLSCMDDVAAAMRPVITGTTTPHDRELVRHLYARMGVTEPASCAELSTHLIRVTEVLGKLPQGSGGRELNVLYNETIKLLGQ